MSWQKVCSPKEMGGLGIKNLDLFNLSLLGKWRWRLLVEKCACWEHIIKFRYGELGRVEQLGKWSPRKFSQWWKDLGGIDLGLVNTMYWFSKEIRRKVGNGKATSFWHEAWFGNSSLKEEFPRLFFLSDQSQAVVVDMGWWDGDVWRWKWKWRRAFFTWEEEFFQLFCDTMAGVYLSKEVDDVWVWIADNSSLYSVIYAYDLLLAQQQLLLSNPALV